MASYPSVSGNILTYLEILDSEDMFGNVVIKDLDTNKTVTLTQPCFIPSVNDGKVVFGCMEGLYMVDTSTLDWDNPSPPVEIFTEAESLLSWAPKIWDHYVLIDKTVPLVEGGAELSYLLYDLDEPYSEGVNPIVLDTFLSVGWPTFGVFEDGVVAWFDGNSIKIYNLNDTTPQIQSFNISTGVTALSVSQDYIAWSVMNGMDIDRIAYKSLSDLEAEPVEILEKVIVLGPKLYDDRMIYMVTSGFDDTAELVYYDFSSNDRYSAQEDIDFDSESGFETSFSYFIFIPPYAISDTTLYWSDLPSVDTGDIYSLSYVGDPVEEGVELPVFSNLPNSSTTINITEGQTITTNPYTIRVKPTSDIGISKVEFYIDDNLICTVTSPDGEGVYSCAWDTSLYHSDVKVIAYDTDSEQVILTRSTTVNLPTGLPNSVVTTPTYQLVQTVQEESQQEPEEDAVTIPEENTKEEITQIKENFLETVEEEGKGPFNIFDYWVYILVGLVVIPVSVGIIKNRYNTVEP